jgi:hypothetical protein
MNENTDWVETTGFRLGNTTDVLYIVKACVINHTEKDQCTEIDKAFTRLAPDPLVMYYLLIFIKNRGKGKVVPVHNTKAYWGRAEWMYNSTHS